MKKYILLGLLCSVGTLTAYSQYTNDALRFSRYQAGSTARFKAMGNASTASGGDLTALGSNPAGIGLFTRTEFAFTPEYNLNQAKSTFLDNNSTSHINKANLNQAGIVFNTTMFKNSSDNLDKGLISLNYGFGYQRTNDFYMDSEFGGLNNSTSMADYFAQLGGRTIPNNLAERSLERYAYDNYLISYDAQTGDYYPETFADANIGNMQKRYENRIGGQSEATFSIGGNISNQIYFGASINFLSLRYESMTQYAENGKAREYVNDEPSGNLMNYNFLFNQTQVTKGSGLNAKFGVIYKATNELRLGLNLQTPSWYTIDDLYTETLDNRGTSGGSTASTTYDFSYNLATPFKASLGANYILNGTALISADVDFVDYSSIRFSQIDGQGSNVISDNNYSVKQNFKSAFNYRLGLEYKLNPFFSVRGGYGLEGSPYSNDSDQYYKAESYTAGLGFRNKSYYVDFAFIRNEMNADLSPYTLANGNHPTALIRNAKNNVSLTLGLRF
ncbi:MAG: hypothetical protein EOO99_09565 [Pedobacter sp.]|nr:MAG: hypothetical protein EOO99_09565 [Pedobacter sp.]